MNFNSENNNGGNPISTALLLAAETSSHIIPFPANSLLNCPKSNIDKSILDGYVIITKTNKEWIL